MRFGIALDFGSGKGHLRDRIKRFDPILHAAEEYGFDAVWVGESYSTSSESVTNFHTASSLLVLAALSSRTTLHLGCGVTLLRAWHPLKLAYDVAVLDQLAGGRVSVGVGLGPASVADRFRADGLSAPRVDEELAAIRALWHGRDGYRGKHLRIASGIHPLPAMPGGPRLLVGGGVPAAARRAAHVGDGWYGSSAYSFDRVARLASTYFSAGPHTAGEVAVNRLTVLSRDAVRGKERGREYAGRAVAAYGAVGALDDRGKPLRGEDVDPERALAATSIVGGADEAVNALRDYAKLGVTEIQFRIAPQGIPIEYALETLRVLGEDVLPRAPSTVAWLSAPTQEPVSDT